MALLRVMTERWSVQECGIPVVYKNALCLYPTKLESESFHVTRARVVYLRNENSSRKASGDIWKEFSVFSLAIHEGLSTHISIFRIGKCEKCPSARESWISLQRKALLIAHWIVKTTKRILCVKKLL